MTFKSGVSLMYSAICLRLTRLGEQSIQCDLRAQGVSGAWESLSTVSDEIIQRNLALCMAWAEGDSAMQGCLELSIGATRICLEPLVRTWEERCRVTAYEPGNPRVATMHITSCEMGRQDLKEALKVLAAISSRGVVECVLGADLDPIELRDPRGSSIALSVSGDGRALLLPTLGKGGSHRMIPLDPGLDCQEWAANLGTVCQAARDMERSLYEQLETAGAEGGGLALLTEPLPNWSVSWTGKHPLGFEARSYCGLWECGALITLTHRFASLGQPTPFAQFYCSAADLDASIAQLRQGLCVLYGRPAPWSPPAQKEEEQ